MRLALEPGQQAFDDARLADAGLAGEQHDPALAALGLLPTAQQQFHLLLAANERRQRARAPRLEPAHAGRLAVHLPRLHGLRQPVHRDGAEGAAVEHPPHQPPRAGGDHHRAGRRRGLQPRRKTGRLADRDTQLCVAGRRLLADDDQARGDADTRLKRHGGRDLQRADSVENGKAGAHGALGIMLIGRRVTEIDEHAIAQVLGDKSVEARHRVGDTFVEGFDQIAHVLGVETCRKRHRVDHVADQDRQLSPLGAARADRRRCFIGTDHRGVDLLVGVPADNGRNRRPVGLRQRGLGDLLDSRRSARRLCAAQLGDERPGCRIGLGVQLAPEQRNEVFVVPERFGIASRGGERLYDQPMRVLTHVVERNGAPAGLQSVFGTTGGEFQFAEAHHGAKGEFEQPPAFTSQPFAKALFADRDVVDQPAAVEIDCRTQRLTAALTDQCLEPADIASDDCGIERHHLAVTLERILAEHFAQPEQGLTQVLLGLRVEVGAPQQARQPLTRLRLGRRTGQIGQQARELFARQADNPIRSGQLEGSEQRKTKSRGWRAVQWRARDLHGDVPQDAYSTLCHGPPYTMALVITTRRGERQIVRQRVDVRGGKGNARFLPATAIMFRSFGRGPLRRNMR